MKDGFTGRLAEISRFLGDDSGWMTLKGKGWEEMPYWLKGYGDLGYVLKDPKIMAETRKWVEGILASRREDGWFAPRELLTREKGTPDLWPPMIALNVVDALICQYEGEERSLLHYTTVLNQLRFSRDPVAVDVLSIHDLDHERQATKAPAVNANLELYHNASLLELGVSDLKEIHVVNVR